MKTPEEMAEEYGADIDLCCGTSDIIIAVEKSFLAGYQAAQQEYEAKIQELETQLENWQHNAIHGDDGR